MSRTLIVTVDAGGNVPPFLAIARELATRGHDVEIAGLHPRGRSELPGGVSLTSVASLGFWTSTHRSSTVRSLARIVRLAASRRVAREVRDLIAGRRPDVVVVDPLLASAVRASTGSGVRTVVVLHTFLSYWAGGYARGPVPPLAALCGTRPLRAWRDADALLVATDPELDAAASPRAPARACAVLPAEWVGTTERAPALPGRTDDGGEPLVLVSLSSTWFPGQADAYQRIVAALGTLPVRAIVTTGGAELETPLDPPGNVDVRGRVPHAELLPRAALVIGHGGHSTTFRALAHGLPLLVIPMHPLLDQPMVGQAVAASGAGLTLPRTAPSSEIAGAVRRLLDDHAFAAAAARMGERLSTQDGARAAADRIERLASTPHPAVAGRTSSARSGRRRGSRRSPTARSTR